MEITTTVPCPCCEGGGFPICNIETCVNGGGTGTVPTVTGTLSYGDLTWDTPPASTFSFTFTLTATGTTWTATISGTSPGGYNGTLFGAFVQAGGVGALSQFIFPGGFALTGSPFSGSTGGSIAWTESGFQAAACEVAIDGGSAWVNEISIGAVVTDMTGTHTGSAFKSLNATFSGLGAGSGCITSMHFTEVSPGLFSAVDFQVARVTVNVSNMANGHHYQVQLGMQKRAHGSSDPWAPAGIYGQPAVAFTASAPAEDVTWDISCGATAAGMICPHNNFPFPGTYDDVEPNGVCDASEV